jgi:hypothetical protein
MRGLGNRDIAIIELQIDLGRYRPDDAGDQLIGKSGFALPVGFRRIAIGSQHASGARACAYGEGELRRYGNVVSDDRHKRADRDVASGPCDGRTSRRRCRADLVTSVAVFEFETEAGGPFVPGGDVEACSIVELEFATWRGALIFQLVHLAPADAQPEIPTISSSGGGCGESDERRARKSYDSEFHLCIPS